MDDGPGRGLTVSFSPATSWGNGLFAAIFGAVPLASGLQGLSLHIQRPDYRSLGAVSTTAVLLAVAAAGFYWVWTRWLHTATVAVENGSVTLANTTFLTNETAAQIPCGALEDVQVAQSHTKNSEAVYSLSLVQDPSRSTGDRSDQRTIWVAGSLPSKEEADWIASRIRDAAEHQAAHT